MNRAFEKILEKIESAKLPFPDECPSYYGNTNKLLDEIKDIVKEVAEEYNNGWIPCSEQLPEEHDSMFAKLKGTDKWYDAMFEKISDDVNATVEFEDGTRKTMTLHTNDGKWNTNNRIVKFNVIAWQPLPEPFKECD